MKKRVVVVENHPENSFMTPKSMRISLPAEPWHRDEDDKKPKLLEEKPRD